jgi:prolyl-tRNA synthetase
LGSFRVKVDDREEKSPGYKFNEWEVKGVPVRIELGPKDLQKNQIMIARRDTSEKSAIPLDAVDATAMQTLLENIQTTLYTQAKKYLDDHTFTVDTLEELSAKMEEGGMAWAPWDGTEETANKIKEKTKATIRLLPEHEVSISGKKDVLSDKPAVSMALFAKAY